MTYDLSALAANVRRVAALLGEEPGECPDCLRPVRLTADGRVPYHHPLGGRGTPHCLGGGQPIGGGLR